MILNMMDLMTSDDITENPDGMRLKPDITEKEMEKRRETLVSRHLQLENYT